MGCGIAAIFRAWVAVIALGVLVVLGLWWVVAILVGIAAVIIIGVTITTPKEVGAPVLSSNQQVAYNELLRMGFAHHEVIDLVKKSPATLPVQDIVRWVMRSQVH